MGEFSKSARTEAAVFACKCGRVVKEEVALSLENDLGEALDKIARLEGRTCLLCGGAAPCMKEGDLLPTDPGIPCTFDPSPVDAARRFFEERNEAREKVRKLEAFKTFVHEFLDRKGIPADPPGKMSDEGCRVGQRLALIFEERERMLKHTGALTTERANLAHENESLRHDLQDTRELIDNVNHPPRGLRSDWWTIAIAERRKRKAAEAHGAGLEALAERLRLHLALSEEVMRSEWGRSKESDQELRERCAKAWAETRELLLVASPSISLREKETFEAASAMVEALNDLTLDIPLATAGRIAHLVVALERAVRNYAFSFLPPAVHPDTIRLDEIEKTKCYPFWNGGVDGWIFIVAKEKSSKIDRRGVGKTVREAIDNCIASKKETKE